MRTGMRSKDLLRFAACAALLSLGAPLGSDAQTACKASDCLVNSAVAQKLQPTSVVTNDADDTSFFSTQSGLLPNVVFVLDNSTSMYEIPYDTLPSTGTFPNVDWQTRAVPGAAWTPPTPAGATPDLGATGTNDLASCHSNGFFEALRDAAGNSYKSATPYPVADSFYATVSSGIATSGYFATNKYYRYVEWSTSSAGGSPAATAPATISAACQGSVDAAPPTGTGL